MREAGDVVAERRGLRRTHARPGLLPSLRLSEPPGFIPGEVLGSATPRMEPSPSRRVRSACSSSSRPRRRGEWSRVSSPAAGG